MKTGLSLITIALALVFSLSSISAKTKLSFQEQLENLSPSERKSFNEHIAEAKRMQDEKRIFESLDSLAKAESMVQKHPYIMQLQAAADIEYRQFDKAEAIYKELNQMAPKNPSFIFNLGEMHFVQSKWQNAKKQFEEILEIGKHTKTSPLYYLTEYKVYICNIKLGNKTAAEEHESKYDYTVDSPIYYCTEYIQAFLENDTIEATKWLERANKVFGASAMTSWIDTLQESGYIISVSKGVK